MTTRRSLFAFAAGGLLAAAAPAFGQVVIQERVMPGEKVEIIPARPPHPGWSWVKGHWRWFDARHEWIWISGRWVEHEVPAVPEIIVETPPPPPSPKHFWVRGHWVWEGDRWQWIHGHWVA
jgi:hypothetical protein